MEEDSGARHEEKPLDPVAAIEREEFLDRVGEKAWLTARHKVTREADRATLARAEKIHAVREGPLFDGDDARLHLIPFKGMSPDGVKSPASAPKAAVNDSGE